jgi:hypothetical protein
VEEQEVEEEEFHQVQVDSQVVLTRICSEEEEVLHHVEVEVEVEMEVVDHVLKKLIKYMFLYIYLFDEKLMIKNHNNRHLNI